MYRTATFDELGTPLRDVTFVVVDLETTGGSPSDAGITEIGAVKVRAGEVVGEFQTLVNPDQSVPPFVAALTGITDLMLVGAPGLATAVPAFLDFAAGAVLVAHNAGYDVGFLKGACARLGLPWTPPTVLDTVRLARQVLVRDEVRDCRLATLAAHFRTTTQPSHRALADARATVEVLHALLERVGDVGVHSLEELLTFSSRVTTAQRRKRVLAEGLPEGPGVYVFEDDRGRALYVGTSRSIRRRVRSYFTASEQRSRMAEMVALAHRVVPIECATALEARVRELRLIAERQPRYNRRSRRPDRQTWVKLTSEPFPRLSLVRNPPTSDASAPAAIGPFRSRQQAQAAVDALLHAIPLRTCTPRLSARPRGSACILAELGRCPAPCTGAIGVSDYAELVAAAEAAMTADARPVTRAAEQIMATLAGQHRFEDAGTWRDRLAAFVRGADRAQRIASVAGMAELVAARPTPANGWEIHVVRHGRLAGAATVAPGLDPRPAVVALRATAEQAASGLQGAAAAAEETEAVLAWLAEPGVRLVRLEGGRYDGALAWPRYAAGRELDRVRAPQAVPYAGGSGAPSRGGRLRERPAGLGGGPLSASRIAAS
ncbi:MAG: DEDD exonuclease domain-containing protein [Actinomycetota bacterium]|nr:MAG: DEDD exonuclease domain-containing protein [Actinomycetota bacterium]